uniref:NADH dehydrogenase subunit 4 n=1 Tax=Oxyethira ecornuta TaxID=1401674 RepID=UPI0022DCDC00|nr:NADH dehydrogenase subunit 4 [Oxyethira ecornuta]UZZ44242.1 NADH dehydrogenase subunit 4 [Oxyethira ecornuta]
MLKILFSMFFMMPLCLSNMFMSLKVWLMVLFFFLMSLSLNFLFFSNLSYFIYYDYLSYMMILLTLWLSLLMLMASMKILSESLMNKVYLLTIFLMVVLLILTFSCSHIFMFYIFFEASLIPIFMLVMGWGYQPERLSAGIFLLFYTLFASLPLMLGIFYLYYYNYSMMFLFLKYFSSENFLVYLVTISAFLVKMPMFGVHLWLPRAHVEAPVSGSMILAGIMLKLGGYGLMRLLLVVEKLCLKMSFFWLIISLWGGLAVSLFCLKQIDMKMLVAYSSVVHMAFVIAGLMSLTNWGFTGSLILMVGHGLCSSGLFYLINVVYERFHSRNMFISKGMLIFMPTMSMMWFLFLSSNMSAPLSLNLFGEIMLLVSILYLSTKFMLMIMLISFFSAAYSLYLFMYSQHGAYYSYILDYGSGLVREYYILFMHWIPLNIIFLHLDLFLV